MANRRQLLLSQLKNNLDIVSKAIGIDKDKSNESDHPLPDGMLQGPRDVDMRVGGQNYGQQPFFPSEKYPVSYNADNGSYGHNNDRGFYENRYEMPQDRTKSEDPFGRTSSKPFTSSTEIESEEAFLYGSERSVETKGREFGFHGNSGGQAQCLADERNKFSFKGPVTSTELQSGAEVNSKFPYGDNKSEPGLSAVPTKDEMLEKIFKTIGLDGTVSSLVHELLKKDSLPRLPNQNLQPRRKTLLPDPIVTPSISVNALNQGSREKDTDKQNFLKETQNFLNKLAPKTFTQDVPESAKTPFSSQHPHLPKDTPVLVGTQYHPPPRASEVSLGSQFPHHSRINEAPIGSQFPSQTQAAEAPRGSHFSPAPRIPEMPTGSPYMLPVQRVTDIPTTLQHPLQSERSSDLGTKLPDGRDFTETRLYFKPKPDPVAVAPDSQHADPIGIALNETVSNIRVLEKALASLTQTKTNMMLRPPGSQRDSLLLENMRMQEEISGQIDLLHETANELSQKMKTVVAKNSDIHQPETSAAAISRKSPVSPSPRSPEGQSREGSLRSSSMRRKRYSPDQRSRSRSRSRDRDRRRYRSRSRSRDRRRPYGRRNSRNRSRSRSRSRDSHRRYRDRSRSHERRRSRERKVDRNLSEAERRALGFGSAARVKPAAMKAEDKEKKALELALSMYLSASEYYNGTNVWCQKCNIIFGDVFSLCQHLHSEKHQITVDPEFNKPRPPYVPEIPVGVQSAPSRGYEFVMPLQAFFCSLCCEFTKDIAKAEEHLKSVDHNKKFKQFLNDNPGYELKFLKDVTTAIAREKTTAESQSSESQVQGAAPPETKKPSAGFINPEHNSEETKFRNKFQFKIAGSSKPGNLRPRSNSPDVEIVKVTKSNTETMDRGEKNSLDGTATRLGGGTKDLPRNSESKTDASEPKAWVLKANALVNKPATTFPRNPLFGLKRNVAGDGNATKSASQDMFSSSPSGIGSSFSSKSAGHLQTTVGKNLIGKVLPESIVGSKGSINKKPEEAVVNIGDFEIFDEC